MKVNIRKLNKILVNSCDEKKVFNATVKIANENDELIWRGEAGSAKELKTFAIASITKMFTAAVIFNLVEKKKMSLDDPIGKYVSADILKGIHIVKGKDYSGFITIKQLLCQTSGLADYYTEKSKDHNSFLKDVYEKDYEITLQEILDRTRKLRPHFINGTQEKAYYSDLNFELLGELSKTVTGQSLTSLYSEYIIKPLELKSTYLCTGNDEIYTPIYWGKKKLDRPLVLSSQPASGGIISDADDLIRFLKAFYRGNLFPRKYITDNNWHRIQWFPLEYSMGMMRCKMSRVMSPFIPAPEILGHSGSTGSFAFYCPSKKVYIAGTLNQVKKNPFQLIYRMLNCLD
ncbi:serine hydrolase domain-containing protein [Vallitalea okinawensis]|uniref:serine hydrolase domain-containing protein n=1 Tax=Vallitalea okinawensis TaxID=2078660 RepID=UPI000CFD531A|nr:serine hydrolase domain-containing protein [Vallitalea okinawensis]